MERFVLADGGEIRLIDVGTNSAGQIAILGDFTGSLNVGEGAPVAAQGERDLFLLVFAPDGSVVYRAVYHSDRLLQGQSVADAGSGFAFAAHFSGNVFRESTALGSSGAQSALVIAHDRDGVISSLTSRASESMLANVQAKGLEYMGGQRVECGNYLDRVDFGDGLVEDAGVTGDNAYFAFSNVDVLSWTDVIQSSETPGSQGILLAACALTPSGVYGAGHFDAGISVPNMSYESQGAFDAVVVAYSSTGELRWSRVLAGPGRQVGRFVDASASAVFLGGTASGESEFADLSLPGSGELDGYVAAFGVDGTPRWAFRVESAGDDAVATVDARGDGVLVAGHFSGTLATPAGTLASRGDADGFVLELNGVGQTMWARRFGTTGFDRCEALLSDSSVIASCSLGGDYELSDGSRAPGGSLLVARFVP